MKLFELQFIVLAIEFKFQGFLSLIVLHFIRTFFLRAPKRSYKVCELNYPLFLNRSKDKQQIGFRYR